MKLIDIERQVGIYCCEKTRNYSANESRNILLDEPVYFMGLCTI